VHIFKLYKICNVGGGVDYSNGPYHVTIVAGMTEVSIDVPIDDDNICELNETFALTIDFSSLPNGVSRGSVGNAQVIIVENDRKYIYTYRFNILVVYGLCKVQSPLFVI